jgi:DNA-binding NtrC family response regulator
MTRMSFDVAVLDVLMPEIDGFELMNIIKKISSDTLIIIHTGMAIPDSIFSDTVGVEVFAYLKKPCKLQVLKDTVARAFSDGVQTNYF